MLSSSLLPSQSIFEFSFFIFVLINGREFHWWSFQFSVLHNMLYNIFLFFFFIGQQSIVKGDMITIFVYICCSIQMKVKATYIKWYLNIKYSINFHLFLIFEIDKILQYTWRATSFSLFIFIFTFFHFISVFFSSFVNFRRKSDKKKGKRVLKLENREEIIEYSCVIKLLTYIDTMDKQIQSQSNGCQHFKYIVYMCMTLKHQPSNTVTYHHYCLIQCQNK